MKQAIIVKIAKEIIDEAVNHWEGPTEFHGEVPEWDGPSGEVWCKEKKKNVDPNNCPDCPDCEAVSQVDEHPPRLLRPTEMSW
jgi:hypothetical protein